MVIQKLKLSQRRTELCIWRRPKLSSSSQWETTSPPMVLFPAWRSLLLWTGCVVIVHQVNLKNDRNSCRRSQCQNSLRLPVWVIWVVSPFFRWENLYRPWSHLWRHVIRETYQSVESARSLPSVDLVEYGLYPYVNPYATILQLMVDKAMIHSFWAPISTHHLALPVYVVLPFAAFP